MPDADTATTALPAVVILDGGMGTELAARGHDLSDTLWSARLLLTDPESIEAVHLDYFRAGANVATTASYQASIEGYAAAGLDGPEALRLIARSVELAASARDRHRSDEEAAGVEAADNRTLLVAGSVGPYGAMLADGSEYRGDYDISADGPRGVPPAAHRCARRGRGGPARVRDDPDGPRGRGPRGAARRRCHPGLAVVLVPGRFDDIGR